MLFNSLDFAVFLPLVFAFYWLTRKNLTIQNLVVLAASYVFYAWWDWRFLSLIVVSTCVDYFVGLKLAVSGKRRTRKILLWTSILVNIGMLGFFKYFNFFVENFVAVFSFFGQRISPSGLNIILPVGISFYTFQTLSYTIDVYRRKISPTRSFPAFAAFVAFFPQLVAGPIERAANLLPQFLRKREFDYSKATDGLRQMLWGFFKKLVIADNCAVYVNQIFDNSAEYPGSTLFIGALLFAFQIYGDFSGYSDIAIGTARLFGFNLMKNFAFPYFARDIAEFWRRWHISLTTWFRDYLYIPLGGSRAGSLKRIRNVFIIFLVSGLWHGANWNFIIWGGLHALFFLPLLLGSRNRRHLGPIAGNRILPSLRDFTGMVFTFLLTLIAWVFFRAETPEIAFTFLRNLFSPGLFTMPVILPKMLLLIIAGSMLVEWFQRNREHALEIHLLQWPGYLRWTLYFSMILIIYFFGNFSDQTEFIYFQF